LRTLTKSLGGTAYNFDIQTYVLGMGLSSGGENSKLDAMAVRGYGCKHACLLRGQATQLATE